MILLLTLYGMVPLLSGLWHGRTGMAMVTLVTLYGIVSLLTLQHVNTMTRYHCHHYDTVPLSTLYDAC